MCGIVGLFAKTEAARAKLGDYLSDMLIEMTDRGPDSAGVAFYSENSQEGTVKVCLHSSDPEFDWEALAGDLEAAFGSAPQVSRRASHAVVAAKADYKALENWLKENRPELRIVSVGDSIEIFKEMGLPADVVERFELRNVTGSHALGHTRMATESAVTTEHSHPFSTGLDLCLVHNGSLSNHNRLRQELIRHGIEFRTDNDTEVAAGYLTWRLREGDTLEEAMTKALSSLDGFYTFAVGTRDGFAVLRDPIACKHAVLAETDDWVAMASEFRSIAKLPGADSARIWEPVPGRVYSWTRN